MKIFRLITCLFVLMFAGAGAQAAKNIGTLITPIGYSTTFTHMTYYLEILTPDGVYYGVYAPSGNRIIVEDLHELSWTGPSPGPTVRVEAANQVGVSTCTGLSDYDATSKTYWDCYNMTLGVYYDGHVDGCPWLISTHVDSYVPADNGAPPYAGPKVHNSSCPVSVASYDISWSEDYILYTKVLSLQSTGGIIEKTLPTYLMESGKLCDGSQLDDRGAYCRFVSQMITFSTSGCDSSSVTVTPNRHPITDKQLHDMVVQVDTSSRQPIDSTCRFQYTLNEL